MLIKNVKIINHDKTIECADVEIKNNLIHSIKKNNNKPKQIMIPGFIDTHTHGLMGYDAMDSKEVVEKISHYMAKNGTTSFFPTLMTAKWEELIKACSNASKAKQSGARISGLHIEGPFISKIKKGAHKEKYIIKPTLEKIKELINVTTNNRIKKITIAPEVLDKKIVTYLIKNKIVVSLGHSNANSIETNKAIDYGATSATHLWNAMTTIENRNPGLAEIALIRDEVYPELIMDFIHIDKETIKLSIKAKGVSKIIAVTDSIRPASLKDGVSKSGGFEVNKKGLLITIKGTNTIAGSGATMFDIFKNIISMGYSGNQAVAMTSYNATKNLDIKGGIIKKGELADFLLLDLKMSKIKDVYIDGVKQ